MMTRIGGDGMEEKVFVSQQGVWLKGNLHSHSTASDGDLAPEAVIRAYAQRGYDFLSLTDHNVYAEYDDYEHMIMIPGFELTCYLNQKRVHLNFIQRTPSGRFAHGQQFVITDHEQSMAFIEQVKDEYWIMLNHPDWSLLEYRDVQDFSCFNALEVLNYGTEWYDRVGESAHFWDTCLRDGKRWPAVATDDNHNGYVDSEGWPFGNVENDSFGGWVMVKAASKSRKDILQALDEGQYYATGGPEIYDFRVQGEYVKVTCSPVSRIIFKGENRNFVRKIGTGLTEFIAPLRGNKEFVRVECIDESGRTAYSNPIYLH